MKANAPCRKVRLHEVHGPHQWRGLTAGWQCLGLTAEAADEYAVTIEIHLNLRSSEDVETIRGALDSLADVMLVQAEDGLYLLGSPDAENGKDENIYVGDLMPHDTPIEVTFG